MTSPLPGGIRLANEPQIDLVHQRRRLQRVTGRRPTESRFGQRPQLTIEERKELIRRRLIALGRRREKRLWTEATSGEPSSDPKTPANSPLPEVERTDGDPKEPSKPTLLGDAGS